MLAVLSAMPSITPIYLPGVRSTSFRNCGTMGTSISLEMSVSRLTTPNVDTVAGTPNIFRSTGFVRFMGKHFAATF